jgi:hypothetical protein
VNFISWPAVQPVMFEIVIVVLVVVRVAGLPQVPVVTIAVFAVENADQPPDGKVTVTRSPLPDTVPSAPTVKVNVKTFPLEPDAADAALIAIVPSPSALMVMELLATVGLESVPSVAVKVEVTARSITQPENAATPNTAAFVVLGAQENNAPPGDVNVNVTLLVFDWTTLLPASTTDTVGWVASTCPPFPEVDGCVVNANFVAGPTATANRLLLTTAAPAVAVNT